MYDKNNSGPRVDPWGTPHVTKRISEQIPFTVVHCFRFVKKL